MSELFERLQQHGRRQSTRTAVWRYRRGEFTPTTYEELAASARAFANAFGAQLPEGQIIPMLLARTPDCIAAMLGALGAGCALSCVNPKLRPPQIERILVGTKTPIALIDGPGLMALKTAILAGSPIASVRWWLLRGPQFGKTHERLAAKLAAIASVEDWDPRQWQDESKSSVRKVEHDVVGCCLFTSGSTGTPKGVLISHGDLEGRAESESAWFDLRSDDVLLSILPFSFDVGLNQLMSFLWIGCELALLDSWFSKDIMNAIELRKVTGISAVPSIWQDFLTKGHALDTAGAHASLRYLTVSGGALSSRDLDRLPEVAPGAGIYKTYGQTEAFRGSSLRPAEYEARRESVGRAFQGARIYVVRDDGTPAAPNEKGEVIITGLGLMSGYLDGNDPENKLRRNPFTGHADASELAIFTGDEGHLDEEGYLYLAGRRDEMVKIQGNRIYPHEVLEQLAQIEGVAQAEVIPVKHSDDTRLVAFVVGSGSEPPSEADLMMKMGALVPSYMIPSHIVTKQALPLTASGKPDRPQLAAEAAALLESHHDYV
ncbi:MAG: AMP-binding protein [Polyangiales bacterium]